MSDLSRQYNGIVHQVTRDRIHQEMRQVVDKLNSKYPGAKIRIVDHIFGYSLVAHGISQDDLNMILKDE